MNISPRTVSALRGLGWDVVRVSEILPASSTDLETPRYARQQERAVVTQDLDSSTLLALDGHVRPSLITLRLAVADPETITRRLVDVLPGYEQEPREGCALTLNETTVRVRRLPLL